MNIFFGIVIFQLKIWLLDIITEKFEKDDGRNRLNFTKC